MSEHGHAADLRPFSRIRSYNNYVRGFAKESEGKDSTRRRNPAKKKESLYDSPYR